MRNETERVRGWVGSMYVAGSLFYIGGHGHHFWFLNRTDSEGGYHCRFLKEPTVEVHICKGYIYLDTTVGKF